MGISVIRLNCTRLGISWLLRQPLENALLSLESHRIWACVGQYGGTGRYVGIGVISGCPSIASTMWSLL